jgi:Family of unknown function (DUF6116)
VAGGLTKVFQRLGLRFPALFVILLTVTLADLVVPDVIPFVDEIVLAALTALFGLWRERRAPAGPARDSDPTRAA